MYMLSFQAFGTARKTTTPLVLLHGWGGEWRSWFPIIERFKKTHRVYVPDLPGFGETPMVHARTLDNYVEEVLAFLAVQKLKKAYLVGHSFGGAIAALVAARNPELVKKLVLVDASGIRTTENVSRRAFKAAAGIGRRMMSLPLLSKAFPAIRKAIYSVGPLKSSDYAALQEPIWKETFRNILEQDISNELVKISVPTLVIWGSEDKEAPLWMGERMHALIPASQMQIFKQAGHFPYLDQTDRFEEIVRGFLK